MLALVLLRSASAQVPMDVFPYCAPEAPEQCPVDLTDWFLRSGIPPGSDATVRPAERDLGAGMGLDVAVRYTAGHWDVPVAILDSGIYWRRGNLAAKVRLNAAELPLPQLADGALVPGGDRDGNGVLNVFDYAEDPRVAITAGPVNEDDILDPGDLIATFSDGVDDDGNGYTDDIAGWDFFNGDNDPYAELQAFQADHGSGVMSTAADSGNDGGDIGVCPNCSILPVRVGDSFVTSGDKVAMGIAYATDAGARSIGMALGGLTHPRFARQAVAYARSRGVVLVGVAGDENSYHQNFPGADDPILYVHSVRGNNQDEDSGTYSYFNTWNCNNWGPRLDLVASSPDCATGSAAAISGAAALVASAGDAAALDLTSDEVVALLRTTADDIWLTPEEQEEARSYPSQQGWDAFHGYGRVNVGRAVQQVFEGEIPPVADLTAPRWFSWVDPDGGPIDVTGHCDARAGLASWRLEVGTGAEPADWTEVASGTDGCEGVLASFDPSPFGDQGFAELQAETVVERMYRAHEPLVQLRLTAVDTAGRSSEDRVGVWVHRDPDLVDGFPIQVEGSLEPPPIVADLDGDEVYEVVFASSDGDVYAVDGHGTALPGFPVSTDPLSWLDAWSGAEAYTSGSVEPLTEGLLAGVSAGDLDGDGAPEVVTASLAGKVYAWHADGSRVDGYPVAIVGRLPEEFGEEKAWQNGIAGTPALGDVDGDGRLEVVVAGMDQRLYVWDGQGTLLPGYPLALCFEDYCTEKGARILSSTALGDIDGDGDLDGALGTGEVPTGAAGLMYIVDLAAAEVWPGFPMKRSGLINQSILPVIGEGHPASVGLADLDDDGDLEIVSNAMLGNEPPMHHDGTPVYDMKFAADGFGAFATFTDGAFLSMVSNAGFGDMTGDGVPDLAITGAGVQWLVSLAMATNEEYQHAIAAWDGATGAMLEGFPRQIEDVAFLMAPSIADLDDDGRAELLVASGGHFVHAFDEDGGVPEGWPKFTGGWMLAGPALGDLDGDGWLEVVVATRQGGLFAWHTQGPADQAPQWTSARHDAASTGNYETPVASQPGPDRPNGSTSERRCGCASHDGAPLVLSLGLVFALRRRVNGR